MRKSAAEVSFCGTFLRGQTISRVLCKTTIYLGRASPRGSCHVSDALGALTH